MKPTSRLFLGTESQTMMATDEMFESILRSAGDFAGVFEFDGDAAYFYLYDITQPEKHKILGAVRIFSGRALGFKEDEVAISWDTTETKVGLQIKGNLWAAFDADARIGYGGNYRAGGRAEIPSAINALFQT